METVSLISGLMSIALGVVAIIIAIRESKKSDQNYRETERVLREIETRYNLMDQKLQIIQNHLLDMIKIAMERMGQPYNDIRPITNEEIDEIMDVVFHNKAGGETMVIGNKKDIIERIKEECGN